VENVGNERIFGTDGIRGRAGDGWLSVPAVTSLGAAIGEVLGARIHGASGAGGARNDGARPRVLLGHDGRRSGPELEAALSRGLAQAGFDATSAGLITTPGLALLTKLDHFVMGVMVSASHNPAEDNGIKVFSGEGDKLSDEIEIEIEQILRARPALDLRGPGPKHDAGLEEQYLDLLLSGPGANLRLDGLVIALDCAHGGGSRIAPRVFGRLGAQVISIAAEPDGDNINRGVGATHMDALQAAVRAHKPDLGIALDGDGDRCLLVDEKTEVVHGDGILTLLAIDAMRKKAWKDPRLVATVMSNKGLHRALRAVGVTVVTTDVGDRRVVEAMKREHLKLGGEQSGHVVFGTDHHYIGDGIYTALRTLRVLRDAKKPLSELASAYRPFPQVLLNVNVSRKPSLSEIPSIARVRQQFETELGEDGRILLRYSGTEPLARVMVEGPDADRIREQAQTLADLISAEIGS